MHLGPVLIVACQACMVQVNNSSPKILQSDVWQLSLAEANFPSSNQTGRLGSESALRTCQQPSPIAHMTGMFGGPIQFCTTAIVLEKRITEN